MARVILSQQTATLSKTRRKVNYRMVSNLIRTSFCQFLKRKKKLVRGSNPHQWEDDGEDKDDSDWVTDSDSVMSDDGESDE